jgi:hypothetical protein
VRHSLERGEDYWYCVCNQYFGHVFDQNPWEAQEQFDKHLREAMKDEVGIDVIDELIATADNQMSDALKSGASDAHYLLAVMGWLVTEKKRRQL